MKTCIGTTVLACLALARGMAAGAPAAADSNVPALVAGNTAFACDLYAKLRTADGNLFFSPYSISAALAMTWGGARGETERQMAAALRLPLPQAQLHPAFAALQAELDAAQANGDVTLSVANSLWPQRGHPFLPEYLALARQHYGVTITPVDYAKDAEAARRAINAWVFRKTRERIPDLVAADQLSDATRLVLVNAIHFLGKWREPFPPSARFEEFHAAGGRSVEAWMMSLHGKTFPYADYDSLQALALPYRSGRLSMLVLLPKQRDGLARLERALSVATLARWRTALAPSEVLVTLPRFKMTSEFSLGAMLAALGMGDAFATGQADFSGLDGTHDLFIDAVLHKAVVEVNNEGTEAAAATAVGIALSAEDITYRPHPPEFRADHPFLFLIQDDATGSVLFLGRVTDPTIGATWRNSVIEVQPWSFGHRP